MAVEQPELQYHPRELSAAYIDWAERVVGETPSYNEQILTLRDIRAKDPFSVQPEADASQETEPAIGIRWYETNPQREPVPGHTPETVVFYAPHSDDAEIAAGVSLTHQIQKGDHVSVLHFTMGSSGRRNRGFTEQNMPTVRLAEAIAAGQVLGTTRVGVITLPDGRLGFPEWFTDGNSPEARMLGIALMRKLNPHILYSPHPNMRVDKHPDHVAVAALAHWGHSWGTENEFYDGTFQGEANRIKEWRRYAIWTGEETLPVNAHFRYDANGPFADHKRAAIEVFQSQGGVGYANAALARDAYLGGMIGVGDDDNTSREVFDIVRPTTVITPQWRS